MLDTQLPPIIPTPEEKDLCKKTDEFFGNHFGQTGQAPSKLIKGAIYAMRPECRSNDDWRSQSANSLREVLYPLIGTRIKRTNPIKLFKKYASDGNLKRKITNKDFIATFDTLSQVNGKLNDLTHHGIEPETLTRDEYDKFDDKDFDRLFEDFKKVLLKIFTLQQIFMHGIIDAMIDRKRKTQQLKSDLRLVLGFNIDARSYFFAKADESWLKWLWDNEFLDAIKQKSDDPTKYRHSLPELNYLDRVAKQYPAEVVKIMLQIDLKSNFNPEVIDRIARICADLPAVYLKKIVPKIAEENWIRLMGRFNFHGFEYKTMLETLDKTKDYKNLLILSKAILSIKTKSEMDKSDHYDKNPFCLGDLSYSEVFNHLVQIDDENTKDVLAQMTETLRQALEVLDDDEFFFMEDDVFTLELRDREESSSRGGVRNLMAVIKMFAERIASKDNRYVVDTIFKLPDDSSIARRLKLFVVTLNPAISKQEIKKLLFSVFDADDPGKITVGAEYDTVLQKCFSVLSNKDRQDYVDKAINLPKQCTTDKERERYKHIATGLFPHIVDTLTAPQRKQIADAGYSIGERFKPRPIIGEVSGGIVTPRGPITQEEFDEIPVKDILDRLRGEWSPAELEKKNDPQDFQNPLDAEGVGDLIKNGTKKRFKTFVDSANLFWAKDIHTHYTYSFLRGAEEFIKSDFDQASRVNWNQMISLLEVISITGQEKEHNKKTRYRGWLADIKSVKSMSTNVLEVMLRKQKNTSVIDFSSYRDRLLTIIGALLKQPHPSPEDEDFETATMTTTSQETGKLVSSPYSMALNSVRGGAFQAFILFVYRDNDPLKDDAKKLFEGTLDNEGTKAIFFMFGHYLSALYYGDRKWLTGLLPKIFPERNKQLYLAAWEGYVSANLFEEIFSETTIQTLYKKGLSLTKELDSRREYFRDPEKGIAVHFALAYMHYNNFGIDNKLFKKFWEVGTETQHAEFIDFVGRKYISTNKESDNKADIKKLLPGLWDFILNSCSHKESLTHFGMWINDEKDIFDKYWLAKQINKTLEKTQGALYWDYGLKKSIIQLGEASPGDTLNIIKKHLLDHGVNTKGEHRPIFFETEWSEALTIIYNNPDTKESTVALINALIRDGGSQFWPLKDVLEESE